MRGKGGRCSVRSVRNGITPAYAGKRPANSRVRPLPRDHPRVCGEKRQVTVCVCVAQGSPPRMRGKATFSGRHRLAVGITPAYAGKRRMVHDGHGCFRDHPRVCGEKSAGVFVRTGWRGSPPRMRGKDFCRIVRDVFRGITPAYAGKSWVHSCFHFYAWDHPRVCGEKVFLK